MTKLPQQLKQLIRKELRQNPIPIKTAEGILVGDVIIQTQQHIKNILRNGEIIYAEIHLNAVAIKIANLLALRTGGIQIDRLYSADQEYGRWFIDSQLLRSQYQKAKDAGDHDRADVLWSRYGVSRDKCAAAKNTADALTKS